MIGLDTNVLVRLVVRDDAAQTRQVDALVQGFSAARPGYVSVLVLTELHWVLRSRFALSRSVILEVFAALLALADLRVERRELVQKAISIAQSTRADFSDVLIALQNAEAGCAHTATFDRNAAKLPQMQLVG